MLSSSTFDPSFCMTSGGDVLSDPLDRPGHLLDEGLNGIDEGLDTSHPVDRPSQWMHQDPRTDVPFVLYPCLINDSIRLVSTPGYSICAMACLCTNSLTLQALTESELIFSFSPGGTRLSMPLDVEWTLLEAWGYTAPVPAQDISPDIYEEWETLHVHPESKRVFDSVCFSSGESFLFADADMRRREASIIQKSTHKYKLWWPLLGDRLVFREGSCSQSCCFLFEPFCPMFFGDSQASFMLTYRHHAYIGPFCTSEAVNKIRTKTLSRPVLNYQHLTFGGVGPSLSKPCYFHGQIFFFRISIRYLADDAFANDAFADDVSNEKPRLVSFALEMQDSKHSFSLDKAIEPRWMDDLIDEEDSTAVYYFYVDETFDGNLDKLWSGGAKTYSMNPHDQFIHLEVDGDEMVEVSIVGVHLNGLQQTESGTTTLIKC